MKSVRLLFILALFVSITQLAKSEPLHTFAFSQQSFKENHWGISALPGFQLPRSENGVFLAQDGTREGYRLSLIQGDGILILSPDVFAVENGPAVVTLEYSIHTGSADVAVIALDMNNNKPNGQLGYTKINANRFDENHSIKRLHTLYTPPSGSVSGGVQITLNDNDKSAEITLYSISVYPFDDSNTIQIETNPNGSFTNLNTELITNINNDRGTVQANENESNLYLITNGGGEAANAGVQALSENLPVNDIMTASALVSKQSGNDGMTAMVAFQLDENQVTWESGVFIHNQNLSSTPLQIQTGGSFEGEANNITVVVQNGGGNSPSTIVMDDLFLHTTSNTAVLGLEEIQNTKPGDVIAAAMILPDVMYSGSEGSYSMTAKTAKQNNPISMPYMVTLSNDTETHVIGQGNTNHDGFRADRFTVPDIETGQWTVKVSSANQPLFEGQIQVQDGGVLIIETDKPVYKPGQQIQGRIVYLNNGLTPLQDTITLSIKDAKGIKIHKEILTTNEYGVAKFELPLANELNFGTWKLEAETEGRQRTEKDIEVDRLVLPAFEVNVNLERDWYDVGEGISGSISSRFFFGKPVPGQVKIEALRFVGEWQTYQVVEGRLEDGVFDFELNAVSFVTGSPSSGGAGNAQLKVTVTDDTGHEEQTDVLLRIVDSGLDLSLIPESNVLKPGLSQELIVVAKNPAGAPLDAEVLTQVFYIAEDGSVLDEMSETVSVINGVASITLSVPERTSMVNINAKTEFDEKTVSENLLLNSMYSPGAFFIHLRQQNEGILQAGDLAVFDVFSTGSGTIFYDVYANGRTLFSNVSNQNQIEFTVTPEMAPNAKLVAYSIQDNNEVSADVLPFAVEFNNTNSIQAQFSAEEVKPGDPVQLSLSSQFQSMVGLAVVDESVFALADGRLNLRNVFAELERIFQEPQIEVHENPDNPGEPEPGPFPRPAGGFNSQPDIEYGSKGTKNVLNDNHFLVLSTRSVNVPETEEIDPFEFANNIRRQFRNGEVPIPLPDEIFFDFDDVLEAAPGAPPNTGGGTGGSQALQEPDRVRSFFPETWLWMPDHITDENGNSVIDLTAPDNITTWKLHAFATSQNGIGITESQLRVFQDFFVEPDLPFAVTRGDQFPMRVRVFNYVDSEQEIRITLEDSENLGLQGEAEQTISVPAQGVSSVTFTLQPNAVGLLPISLVAQSALRADAIRKNLRVEPEGVRRELVHNGVLQDATEVTVGFRSFPVIDPLRETPIPLVEEIVPDSERFFVAITASLLGQTMQGLDNLLAMPFGCGEQNMIFLAPDIEIVKYLKSTGQTMPEVQAKAEFFITTGYQRELTFQRSDGSFSAFGESDDSGSLWLTAFVLNTFSSARDVRTIDETVLSRASDWILSHQQEDGSWEPVGFVIHNELQGGLNGNLALSAFVTLSLLEYGSADDTAVAQALDYLATNMTETGVNSYVLSMITYALTIADHPQADAALALLMDEALVSGSGIYWEPHPIETTGYAVLSLLHRDRIEAQEAINWLASQRNSLGGYGSTQDTVVALKAMTAAAMQQSRDLDSSVDILVNGETVHTMDFNRDNFDVLQQLEIDQADEITLRQSGSGKVLYQVVRAFNVPVVVEPVSNGLDLIVDYSADHVAVDDLVDVNVIISYSGIDEKTGMAVLDVSVPTGFAVEQETLNALKTDNKLIKRIEQAGRKVIFYIDHLVKDEPVAFSFQIRALYPVKADGGANTAFLYYDTEVRTESANSDVIVD